MTFFRPARFSASAAPPLLIALVPFRGREIVEVRVPAPLGDTPAALSGAVLPPDAVDPIPATPNSTAALLLWVPTDAARIDRALAPARRAASAAAFAPMRGRGRRRRPSSRRQALFPGHFDAAARTATPSKPTRSSAGPAPPSGGRSRRRPFRTRRPGRTAPAYAGQPRRSSFTRATPPVSRRSPGRRAIRTSVWRWNGRRCASDPHPRFAALTAFAQAHPDGRARDGSGAGRRPNCSFIPRRRRSSPRFSPPSRRNRARERSSPRARRARPAAPTRRNGSFAPCGATAISTSRPKASSCANSARRSSGPTTNIAPTACSMRRVSRPPCARPRSRAPISSALARARIAAARGPLTPALAMAVPPPLRNDPGLLFARIQDARRSNRAYEAATLLDLAPRDPRRPDQSRPVVERAADGRARTARSRRAAPCLRTLRQRGQAGRSRRPGRRRFPCRLDRVAFP